MVAPNATVAGGELNGISNLCTNLMQSQEGDQLSRVNNLDIQANSYINNSSVAKTAVHKRRNISIGVVNQADRGGLESAQRLNGLTRPNVGNTYDGSHPTGIKTSSNH